MGLCHNVLKHYVRGKKVPLTLVLTMWVLFSAFSSASQSSISLFSKFPLYYFMWLEGTGYVIPWNGCKSAIKIALFYLCPPSPLAFSFLIFLSDVAAVRGCCGGSRWQCWCLEAGSQPAGCCSGSEGPQARRPHPKYTLVVFLVVFWTPFQCWLLHSRCKEH